MGSGDRVVLVGSLPPPMNGQSIAFETLVSGLRGGDLRTETVDITGGESDRDGRATLRRAVEYLAILARFVAALPRADTVYLQIAQSRHGFARDAAMIALAHLLRRRIVCHLHGGNYDLFYREQPRRLQACIRFVLRRVDRILVLGEGLRSMFDFAPELADRIDVVANGLPDTAPEAERREPPAPGAPLRVLFMSNLFESKGFLVVLRALDRLQRDGIPVSAVFCGAFRSYRPDDREVKSADHARQLFEDFVRERELGERVEYRGVVSGAEKERALREAHVFVLPTWYGKEGQPISIIEAISRGLVVVSTRYRAIPDLVRDGESGILLDEPTPEALAEALRRLATDPARYRRMSAEAAAHFERHFTRERHVERVAAVLRSGPVGAPPDRA